MIWATLTTLSIFVLKAVSLGLMWANNSKPTRSDLESPSSKPVKNSDDEWTSDEKYSQATLGQEMEEEVEEEQRDEEDEELEREEDSIGRT